MIGSTRITFKYQTASNFLIFVNVQRNTVKLTVSFEDAFGIRSHQILETELTNESEPWVVINSYQDEWQSKYNSVNRQLKTYILEFELVDPEKVNSTDLTVHI